MGKISEKDIKDSLSKAMHPEMNFSLIELGMIKNIKLKDKNISLDLMLPFLEIPIREDLINLIKDSLKNLDKNIEIKIETVVMDETEKTKFMEMANQGWKF